MTNVIDTLSGLTRQLEEWRHQHHSIALIPTLGCLHDGHRALMRAAQDKADKRILSIFLNPTQFAPQEDLANYPHTPDKDKALADKEGIDVVFMPSVATMYPPDFCTQITLPELSNRLCGQHRPHHFPGVLTVVARLFQLTRPDYAVFGEKDFQQLQLIRRMTSDLALSPTIVAVPTVREADGLAVSSRNLYLSAHQRRIAPHLYTTLHHIRNRIINDKANVTDALSDAQKSLQQHGFNSIDYMTLCDETTLAPIDKPQTNARLFAAAYLGQARLIDNLALYEDH
ncbi:MAG: pantoate--beta-alanine ligase [Alphaproteobacteria bacterium GM202ARS2]|nr:pantoate--beta-alanine ligase [Alphaproteobacteria bacterium GM202ARS2]